LLAGCSGAESRLQPPDVDVGAVGTEAISQYDTNKDGALDGAELDKAFTLKNSLAAVDANKDGRLIADEITEYLTPYREYKVAMMPLSAQVSLNAVPLADATVTLVPEKFMGDAVKTATGTTDSTGLCTLAISQEEPGTHIGFFRVEVSKKNAAGQEIIPAKYNKETQLGGIIVPGSPLLEETSLVLRLSGK
jgi:hypothetical protein